MRGEVGDELVHLLAQRQPPVQRQEAHLLVRGVLGKVADVVAAVDQDAVLPVDRAQTAPSDDDSLQSALVGHARNPTAVNPDRPTPPSRRGCPVRLPKHLGGRTRVSHRVTLIPGDGTGPEIAEATRRVLDATGVAFDWDVQDAGADVMERHGGNPLPDARGRLDPAQRHRHQGADHDAGRHRLPVGQRRPAQGARPLRQVRPCKHYPGVRTRYADAGVDLVIVRENTEDLYAGHRVRARIAAAPRELADGHRAPLGRAHQRRLRHLDQADLRGRHAADRPVRLRLRPRERPQARSPRCTRRTS